MPQQPLAQPYGSACLDAFEAVQHWQDASDLEGVSLEWMLDRARAAREART
ncbi:MAG TPA: hypothetical protein VIN05_05625 [Roseovarius sp.]